MHMITRCRSYLSREYRVSNGCDGAVPEFCQQLIGRSPDRRLLCERIVHLRDQMEQRLTWYTIYRADGVEPGVGNCGSTDCLVRYGHRPALHSAANQ
jgi:hypothetical protein